ncbi:hypothetical protein D0Z00_002482 [Geotrichum galactomycetum]|uniref:Uncharacterized protein n=1 Tax=Geotrichum galactomycetum TaxID=27317 RepID=A0ACB6V400_9ASCO|nr:hypothetical protein D0Z00_002482 [Geotrichum candidum]
MIAARSLATKSVARVAANSARVFSTTSRTQYLVPSDEQQAAAIQKQSPNRAETWAKSQKPRSEALQGVRTLQRNLEQQPQPYAAINLISQTPIVYLHDNTAVCDGGKGVQGHPKIFINLDKPKAHACLYLFRFVFTRLIHAALSKLSTEVQSVVMRPDFPGCVFIEFASVDAAQTFTHKHETVALSGSSDSSRARVCVRYYWTIPTGQNVASVALGGLTDIGESPTALLLLRHVPAAAGERALFDAVRRVASDRAVPTRVLLIRRKGPVFNFSAGLAFVEFRSVEAASKVMYAVEGAGARRRAIVETVLDGVQFSFTSLGAFEIAGYPYHYSFLSSGGVRLQYSNHDYYVSEYPVPAGDPEGTKADDTAQITKMAVENVHMATASTPDQTSSLPAATTAILNPLIQEPQGFHKRKTGSTPVPSSIRKKLKQWQTKHEELLEEVRQKKREAATTPSPSASSPMGDAIAGNTAAAATTVSYGDYNRLNCFLCYRHFTSSEKLSNHERLSNLHRINLLDHKIVTRANRIHAGLTSPSGIQEVVNV